MMCTYMRCVFDYVYVYGGPRTAGEMGVPPTAALTASSSERLQFSDFCYAQVSDARFQSRGFNSSQLSKERLGIEYKDMDESITVTVESMLKWVKPNVRRS